MERPRVGSSGHDSVKPCMPGCPGYQLVRELVQQPPYSCGLAGGEGRGGGPCGHLQAPRSHPSRWLCLKPLNMEALEGPQSRAPGAPRRGRRLPCRPRPWSWRPWRGGLTVGRGRRERLLVPEGSTHGRARGAPSPRLGVGRGWPARAMSHHVGNEAQGSLRSACTRDSQPGLNILADEMFS